AMVEGLMPRTRKLRSKVTLRQPITVSLDGARRLAVLKQGLGRRRPGRASKESLLSVVRDLAYVQWDPVPIVAPSHLLSFWARVGKFRVSDLEVLLWKERKLMLHWIPFAALVLTKDFPLYASLMKRFPDSFSDSWGRQREQARKFLAEHVPLRRKVLRELRGGQLTLGQFEDHSRTRRDEGDWGSASDVSLMLDYLLMRGEVMIVGHERGQSVWGLVEEFLPSWADQNALSPEDADCSAAVRAIRALGTATPKEIKFHFIRGCYSDLPGTLGRLCERSVIHRVEVPGSAVRHEERYIHDQDLSLLEKVETQFPESRVSLLPPFDNMVCSQARLIRLFGFDYVREQFLPRERRRFGTYVLPILWGDRFIGRIDPRFDKKSGRLVVNSVHAEPGAPEDRDVAGAISAEIADLANFVGASEVRYTTNVPEIWRNKLQ
ncbi:MAG: crosslink repair DNA glycosylase YcaQ family protein, partial [Thermoplasmata archaeon]